MFLYDYLILVIDGMQITFDSYEGDPHDPKMSQKDERKIECISFYLPYHCK